MFQPLLKADMLNKISLACWNHPQPPLQHFCVCCPNKTSIVIEQPAISVELITERRTKDEARMHARTYAKSTTHKRRRSNEVNILTPREGQCHSHPPVFPHLQPQLGVLGHYINNRITSEGLAMSLPSLGSAVWGMELPVAHPGAGREWYCILYSPQIRNKHHHSVCFHVNIRQARTAVGPAMHT